MQAANEAAKRGRQALERARKALRQGSTPAHLVINDVAVLSLENALAAAERPGEARAAADFARQAAALCDAAAQLLSQPKR
jgi:hypothetical protein